MSVLRMLIENALREASRGKLRESIADVVDAIRPEHVDPPPLASLVIVFALHEEAVGVLDRLHEPATFVTPIGEPDAEGDRPVIRETHGSFAGWPVTVLETGVGAAAAVRAALWYSTRDNVAWVISAGFAGALDERLAPGDFLLADAVVQVGGERLATDLSIDAASLKRVHTGAVLTCDRLVRTANERRRLAAASGAVACDLESWPLLHELRRAPLTLATDGAVTSPRFLSVRIISDGMDDELPPEIDVLARQENWAGRLGAAAGAIFRRPAIAKDLMKFQNESLKLADRLAKFLEQVVPQLQARRASE